MIGPIRWICTGMCFVSIMAVPVSTVADVGRLFFTPSERAAFEGARRAEEAAPVHELVEPGREVTL